MEEGDLIVYKGIDSISQSTNLIDFTISDEFMETLRNIFYSSKNRNQDNSSSLESTYENLSDINFNLNSEKKPLKINKKRKNMIRDKIKNKKSKLGKPK